MTPAQRDELLFIDDQIADITADISYLMLRRAELLARRRSERMNLDDESWLRETWSSAGPFQSETPADV
jgi:hypothetical protein